MTYWVLRTQFLSIAVFCFLGYLLFKMPGLSLIRVVAWKLASIKKELGGRERKHLISKIIYHLSIYIKVMIEGN